MKDNRKYLKVRVENTVFGGYVTPETFEMARSCSHEFELIKVHYLTQPHYNYKCNKCGCEVSGTTKMI